MSPKVPQRLERLEDRWTHREQSIETVLKDPSALANIPAAAVPWRAIGPRPPALYMEGGLTGYAVTTTTVGTPLDLTNLSGRLTCSGLRPVRVTIACTAIKSVGGYGSVNFTFDGKTQDHRILYVEFNADAGNRHYCGFGVVDSPSKGDHTITITSWQSGGGTLTLYSDLAGDGSDSNRLVVIAEEF